MIVTGKTKGVNRKEEREKMAMRGMLFWLDETMTLRDEQGEKVNKEDRKAVMEKRIEELVRIVERSSDKSRVY